MKQRRNQGKRPEERPGEHEEREPQGRPAGTTGKNERPKATVEPQEKVVFRKNVF